MPAQQVLVWNPAIVNGPIDSHFTADTTFDIMVELSESAPPLMPVQQWIAASRHTVEAGIQGNFAVIPMRSEYISSANLLLETYAKAVPQCRPS